MSLDIYVMPLWRFKAGDFRSPIEVATGIRPKIVTPDGIEPGPDPVGWLGRWRARRQVAAIRRAVEAVHRSRIRWDDEGGVVYAEQSRGIEPLRAFAKWLDCEAQFPEFTRPPDNDYYQHPVMPLELHQVSCPHLVWHDCFNGYYLPCEFEELMHVEPHTIYGHWPATRPVGSSLRLLRELDLVQERLQVPSTCDYALEDPLLAVKAAYLQMREAAELSCRQGLPIIFWG